MRLVLALSIRLMNTKNTSVSLKIEERISVLNNKIPAFEPTYVPSYSNFAFHFRRIIRVYGTSANEVNIMLLKYSCLVTNGAADPGTEVRELE